MKTLEEITYILFFTRRVGLVDWANVGNLQREAAIYQQLAGHLKELYFLTYGGKKDQAFQEQIAPVQLAATAPRLPTKLSQFLIQRDYDHLLQRADILKTNQIPGAEIAIWAKKKYGKKLIARCGYLYSHFMASHTGNFYRRWQAVNLERHAFLNADASIVTSERDRQWVINQYGLPADKISVAPNYVLVDIFKPLPTIEKKYDLVCVAKASPQKNIASLLQAIKKVNVNGRSPSLLLIGSAAAAPGTVALIAELGLSVELIQRVPNFDLPSYLNQATIFVLPSLYEGHPKTLLEAMSCGLACIGTDVTGIREDISHGENGYLCQTDPDSIAQAVQIVMEQPHLQSQMGQQARQYILNHYSLQTVTALELEIIQSVL